MNNDNILYKHSVYLDVAKNISKLSKDPNTKVGAVIVAEDGTLVSGGYNGTLQKVDESNIPSGREPSELTLYTHQYNIKTHEYNNLSEKITLCINKYPYMCHAEYNAITFSDRNKLSKAERFGLPGTLNNRTFSSAAKTIQKESKERPFDLISKRGQRSGDSIHFTIV